jgi:hypothetical protein
MIWPLWRSRRRCSTHVALLGMLRGLLVAVLRAWSCVRCVLVKLGDAWERAL